MTRWAGRLILLGIGGIRIAEGVVILLTLGYWCPKWELRFLFWTLRKETK